jgi:hypothetical protein
MHFGDKCGEVNTSLYNSLVPFDKKIEGKNQCINPMLKREAHVFISPAIYWHA